MVPVPLWVVALAPLGLVTVKVPVALEPAGGGPRLLMVKAPLFPPGAMLATVMLWPTLSAGPEIKE